MGKEYEVKEEYGRVIISEYDSRDDGYEAPPISFREQIGFSCVNLSKSIKVFLTLLFDIYGFLYRIGSNRSLAFVVGILQIFTFNFLGILWLVDLISVIATGEICFLKRIEKFESYEELKRQGKKLK